MTGSAAPLAQLNELVVVAHPTYSDARGVLCPIELTSSLKFPVLRMFWVSRVPDGQQRGGHAHKRCSQYLVCLEGQIEVTVDDGNASAVFVLDAGQALLIRPGLWASERYIGTGALLLVLCDRPYEKDDYIADLVEFRAYRRDYTH